MNIELSNRILTVLLCCLLVRFAAQADSYSPTGQSNEQAWRIVNATGELPLMHIHQVHFLAYVENGQPVAGPRWPDTVNVLYGSSVDVIMDFTDPVIRGMSVFHGHLRNHENKGMMAKILFE
jgi:FtsP/CotA-like multicopper oxidase with cupredoxin domain